MQKFKDELWKVAEPTLKKIVNLLSKALGKINDRIR